MKNPEKVDISCYFFLGGVVFRLIKISCHILTDPSQEVGAVFLRQQDGYTILVFVKALDQCLEKMSFLELSLSTLFVDHLPGILQKLVFTVFDERIDILKIPIKSGAVIPGEGGYFVDCDPTDFFL